MTKLSDTQRVILSKAAQHEALLAAPPTHLPAAARQAVLRSMIAKACLRKCPPRANTPLSLGAKTRMVLGSRSGSPKPPHDVDRSAVLAVPGLALYLDAASSIEDNLLAPAAQRLDCRLRIELSGSPV